MNLDAFPEPYVGALDRRPAGVFLGLNPGEAHLGRSGRFADEIRHHGSYSAWAATWPYLRDPWVATKGPNRYLRSRRAFFAELDRAANPDRGRHGHLRAVPLAQHGRDRSHAARPWGRPRFVWQPVRQLGAPVFAFGKPWFDLLEDGLGLQVVDRLGDGGRPYPTKVASRTVLVLRDVDGNVIVAEKHSGSAGPPSPSETRVLREAIEPWLGEL